MIARSDQDFDLEYADQDAMLMVQARDGDTAAFDELTNRYRPCVLSQVTRLMGDDRYSEDLAQEVFLRAYRARETYVAKARFSTWLFIIIRNVTHNARRWLARHPSLPLETAEPTHRVSRNEGDVPANGEHPPAALLKSEQHQFVRLAVEQLCQRQQLAVYYRYYSGMSYAHVAQQLGTSPQAVKSLLCRAREHLRDSLTPYVARGMAPSAVPFE